MSFSRPQVTIIADGKCLHYFEGCQPMTPYNMKKDVGCTETQKVNLVEEQRRKQQRSNYCICGGAKMQHYLGKKSHQPREQRTVNKLLEETTEG